MKKVYGFRNGFSSEGNELLKTTKKNIGPFGSLAVRLGFVSPNQVIEALDEQNKLKNNGEKHTALGMLMVKMGMLTVDQLVEILSTNKMDNHPVSEDAFRLAARLRTSLSESNRVIAFTGVGEGVASGMVAYQVALALARMDEEPVLLMDANFRTPTVHSTFCVPPIPGLSELVEKKESIQKAISPTDVSGLSVLPIGNAAVDFLSLLSSDAYVQLLNTLRQQYQFIIIGTSPVLQFPDTVLMTSNIDGVVLVVDKGIGLKSELLQVKRLLEGVKANILGVLLCEKTNTNGSSYLPMVTGI